MCQFDAVCELVFPIPLFIRPFFDEPQSTTMQYHLFDRRQAIAAAMSTGMFAGLLGGSTVARAVALQIENEPKADSITAKQIADSCWIAGVTWTDQQCEEVATAINKKLKMLRVARENPPWKIHPCP
jgi:hypothetical protein